MEQQLSDPRLLTPDFSKPEVKHRLSHCWSPVMFIDMRISHFFCPKKCTLSIQVPLLLHTIMLALDAFLEQHARLPSIG